MACVRGGGDPTKPGTTAGRAVRAVADGLLCADRPGDFNQAMMELGATVGRCRFKYVETSVET